MHDKYGPPDLIRIEDVPAPEITAGDVLIKVHATTVNRTDSGFRTGRPKAMRLFTGLRGPRVRVLGCEFAGVVAEAGPEVTSFQVGDRVFGFVGGFGLRVRGSHAEYISMPGDGALALIPPGMTFEQVVASTEGSNYALSLINGARVERGHEVLVYGASGAIGSAAVQLLKVRGATVTAVCGTNTVELVRSLGADRVVDYLTEDFTQDEQTYDAVLDAVGKTRFRHCRHLLKPGGLFLASDLGPRLENIWLSMFSKRVRFPFGKPHDQALLAEFRDLLESGAFRPVVDRAYPFEQIAEAFRYVESGQKIGNVVVTLVA
jgi:NADPH:quinone reductase-like Zn-dependent oxidoreductase